MLREEQQQQIEEKRSKKSIPFLFHTNDKSEKDNICFIILHIHADFFTLHTGIDSVVDSDVWARSGHRYFETQTRTSSELDQTKHVDWNKGFDTPLSKF